MAKRPRPLINVLIPYQNKWNYLRVTLCTLREAVKEYPNVHIYLFNTNGNKDGQKPELVEDLPVSFYNVGPFKSIELMYHHILPLVFKQMKGKYLTIIEADAVLHPLIFKKGVSTLISELPNMGMGSVFNTPFHKTIVNFPAKKNLPDEDGKKNVYYLEKASLGFFGSVIRKDLWRGTRIRGVHGGAKQTIDWSYGKNVAARKLKLYCTGHSFIEHIGFEGKHQRKVHCKHFAVPCAAQIDRAINFYDL